MKQEETCLSQLLYFKAHDDDYLPRRSRLIIYAGGVTEKIVYEYNLGIFMTMAIAC